MASFLSNSTLSEDFSNLIIYVTDEWKLRELPVVVNRSREGWDIYISYNNELGTQDLIVRRFSHWLFRHRSSVSF